MSDLRFQQRDFLGILNDLQSYLQDRLGDEWTDISEADSIKALLEAFAYSIKNLHYYVDQQKRESDFVTAVRPRNVYWKAVRDGYVPYGYRPCEGEITLVFSENTENGVTIPRGTEFQTNYDEADKNLIVTTLYDQTISDGPINVDEENEFTIKVVQGQIKTISKTKQDITQNGYIKLPSEYISTEIGTVKLRFHRTAEETIEWEQTDDVYTDYRNGNFFSVHPLYLRNSTTTMIQFPYNWPELIDTDGEIEIEYLETRGEDGVIPSSKLSTSTMLYEGGVSLLNTNLFDNGSPANAITANISNIYNEHDIIGGTNMESVSSIKVNAKSAIRDLKTLVTLQDYEDFVRIKTATNVRAMDISTDISIPPRCVYIYVELADSVEGYEQFDYENRPEEAQDMDLIGYINYYTGNNDGVNEPNFVWNEGIDNLPHSYSEFWGDNGTHNVVEETNNRRGRRDLILFLSPTYYDYDIEATVWLSPQGETVDSVMDKIVNNLKDNFSEIPQIGKNHYLSKIISTIQESSERIKSVELVSPDTDIVVSDNVIPRFHIKPNAIRFKFFDGATDVVLPENEIVG